MNKSKWCNDREYMSYVGELLERPEVLALDNFTSIIFQRDWNIRSLFRMKAIRLPKSCT